MNPTLYDLLGVSPTASRDEIKRAWRDAADRFEPGEGGSSAQFRLFNEAAEVLLDPERRKAYDREIADRRPAPESVRRSEPAPQSTTAPRGEPAGRVPDAAIPGAAAATAGAGTATLSRPHEDPDLDQGPGTGPGPEPDPVITTGPAEGTARTAPGRNVPLVVLVVLGVLAAAAIGVAAYLGFQARNDAAYQESLDQAPAAAERAAVAVLSYDHESLEADRDAAAKFLSSGYQKDYLKTYELVQQNAPELKAQVEAEVLASSAMVGSGDRDPDRVPVLLFVNQTTVSTATEGRPSVALNRVRFDMVKVDGSWLVDDITSY